MTDPLFWAASKTTSSFLRVVASGQRTLAEIFRDDMFPDQVVMDALIDHMFIRARNVTQFLTEGKSGDGINRTDFLGVRWTPPQSPERSRLAT